MEYALLLKYDKYEIPLPRIQTVNNIKFPAENKIGSGNTF